MTYLDLMKAPQDKRRNVWRGGVLQIWITRACDLSCFACTQGSNLAGKPGMMTLAQFETAIDSLLTPVPYFGVIGVFGGNPVLNPDFDAMCQVLRDRVPFVQRGLWCNNLKGHGRVCRATFDPHHSNINVHCQEAAYQEFARDWPEVASSVRGRTEDSVHSPWSVAMQDYRVPVGSVITRDGIRATTAEEKRALTRAEMELLISNCDVNQKWSSLIGVFRGELRGWFCEIAASQSMLHQQQPDYPDTGVPIVPGWWKQPMTAFAHQVEKHCFECGMPCRIQGEKAMGGTQELVSITHADIYTPKQRGRPVLVTESHAVMPSNQPTTDYLKGVSPK